MARKRRRALEQRGARTAPDYRCASTQDRTGWTWKHEGSAFGPVAPADTPIMALPGRFTPARWTDRSIPPQSGKTFVITGANSGLGLEAARSLARADAHVVLACRDEHKARVARDEILRSCDHDRVEFRQLDLADLRSIDNFAADLEGTGMRIDGLMNNAGVFALDQGRTTDGFETHFGVNHLGHFALTGLLLPMMLDVPGSRIITVSSLGHRPGRIDLADPNYERRRYRRWDAYFQSKLANVLFALELNRRLEAAGCRTLSVAAHPGTARTEIGKLGTSLSNRVIRRFMPVLVRDGVHGARSQVRAAVDGDLRGGEFIGPRLFILGAPVLEVPSRKARDETIAGELWSLSEELTRVRYPI